MLATGENAVTIGEYEPFAHLKDDELRLIAEELMDAFRPRIMVNLSSASRALRTAMQEPLAQLKEERKAMLELCDHMVKRHDPDDIKYEYPNAKPSDLLAIAEAELRDGKGFGKELYFSNTASTFGDQHLFSTFDEFTTAHWRTLGQLIRRNSLPMAKSLTTFRDKAGDAGVISLADGLKHGRMPALQKLSLSACFGPQGAEALALVLTKRTLPSLKHLSLAENPLGDAGMEFLGPAIQQLELTWLDLVCIGIGDAGLASLLPPSGTLPLPLASLKALNLSNKKMAWWSYFWEPKELLAMRNKVTNAGRQALVSAVRGGQLPVLKFLDSGSDSEEGGGEDSDEDEDEEEEGGEEEGGEEEGGEDSDSAADL